MKQFFRLAVSPEPKHRSRAVAFARGPRKQVSKGLKRATGRDEQVQHHLGALNFFPQQLRLLSLAGRPVFPMAVATKTAMSPAGSASIAAGKVALPAPAFTPKPVKLDFAASAKRHPVNGSGKVKKVRPNPRVDLSPQLKLSLDVECDTVGGQEAEIEWWLSAMR